MTSREGRVEAEGLGFRYVESGGGKALVHLSGADGMPLTPAHEALARRFRVVAVEGVRPGAPGAASHLAPALTRALGRLGADHFDVWATSDAVPLALRLALEAPEHVRALVLESPAGMPRDLEGRLAAIATPTLVVLGTRDDVTAAEQGRVYRARMPNAHLVFVYDAGGTIARERPEAFAEVVGDFLERHEAFVISRTTTVIHP